MASPTDGFNIATFKSAGLVLGGARPALFTVQIPIVPAVVGVQSGSTDKFTFTCRAASLPPAQIGIVEIPYFGRHIKLQGDRTFPDWEVTVMNDEDFLVRSMFEKWNNSLNSMEGNVRKSGFSPNETYKTDMLVAQYAKDGSIIRQYKMIGAWPSVVGPIELEWDNQNQIETFGVTIPYDYWEPDFEPTNPYLAEV